MSTNLPPLLPQTGEARLDLEFCPRCGSGPRQREDTVECPDCGRHWSGPRLRDLIEADESPAKDTE